MKKILVVFALFAAMVLVVSCGGGSSSNNDSVTNFGKLGQECYPNKTCDGSLLCDEESNTCVKDYENPVDDIGEVSEHNDETTDTESNDDCDTDGASEHNDDATDTESVDDSDSGEPSEDSDAHQTPCDPNPCLNVLNSTKECIETGDATYSCKCKSGYNWTGSACQSDSIPSLSECNTSTTSFPCKDSSTNYIWSQRYNSMNWEAAEYYCSGLNNYGDYSSGWHLPTISELRTLIQNCTSTQTFGGSCGITDSCIDASNCYNNACKGCNIDSSGKYSKFGDVGNSWSFSTNVWTGLAWVVDFSKGSVGGENKSSGFAFRCVRNAD